MVRIRVRVVGESPILMHNAAGLFCTGCCRGSIRFPDSLAISAIEILKQWAEIQRGLEGRTG